MYGLIQGYAHYCIKSTRSKYPADMYLEGIDQHRGWFQSSLLTSLMLSKEPAIKPLLRMVLLLMTKDARCQNH